MFAAAAPPRRPVALISLLILAVPLMAGCPGTEKSTTEPTGSVSRTECPAGQHMVDNACVVDAAE